MSLLMENSVAKIGCGDPGDPIDFGALFTGSQALEQTFAHDRSDKWALSFWMKKIDDDDAIAFACAPAGSATQPNNGSFLFFNNTSDGLIALRNAAINPQVNYSALNRLTRDFAGWMHVFYRWNSALPLADARYLAINLVPQSMTNAAGLDNFFKAVRHAIGGHIPAHGGAAIPSAKIKFADFIGVTDEDVTEHDFSRINSDGVPVPKTYQGGYGANGFHLDFAAPANMGRDVSPRNACLHSEDITYADWNIYRADKVDAETFVANDTFNPFIFQPLSLELDSSYLIDFEVDPASNDFCSVFMSDGLAPLRQWFDLQNGVAADTQGSLTLNWVKITELSDGYLHCSISMSTTPGYSLNEFRVEVCSADASVDAQIGNTLRVRKMYVREASRDYGYAKTDGYARGGQDFETVGTVEQTTDTPSTNIASLDPINPVSGAISNGNRTVVTPTTAVANETATLVIPISSKIGWRVTPKSMSTASGCGIGIRGANSGALGDAYTAVPSVIYRSDGQKYENGVASAYGVAFAADDRVDVRYDGEAGTIEFIVEGDAQGAIPLPAFDGKFIPALDDFGSGTATFEVDFATAPGAPFGVLSAANFPCPDIQNPKQYVDRRECIGGAGVSDLQFSPLAHDVVIISGRRDLETDWRLNYSIAGVLQDPICTNNPAGGPVVGEDGLTLTGNGFDVGTATPYQGTCWHRIFRVGGLGRLSITRVNHTGGSTVAAHTSGRPIAFGFVIPRAGGDIRTFHHKADAGDYWLLNSNAGFGNDPGWFASSANDLTLGGSLPAGIYDVIGWSEVDQFSSFSKIACNGLINGPQDICDYSPLLMLGRKQGAGESNWIMERKLNPVTTMQYLSGTTILYSSTGYAIDFNSNGLKWRTSSSSWNPAGGFVFTASWADIPGKFAKAR